MGAGTGIGAGTFSSAGGKIVFAGLRQIASRLDAQSRRLQIEALGPERSTRAARSISFATAPRKAP